MITEQLITSIKGYWRSNHYSSPLNSDLIEIAENGRLYNLKLNWRRRDTNSRWEIVEGVIKLIFNNGFMTYSCAYTDDTIVCQGQNLNGLTNSVKYVRDVNLAARILSNLWKFTVKETSESYIVDFVSYDECKIYSENLKSIDGNHSWLMLLDEITVSIDAYTIILNGKLIDNLILGNLSSDEIKHTFIGEKYIPITETALIINEAKRLKNASCIWFTRATKIELDAKLGKNELYNIPGRPPRKIRDRLVYHIDQRCAYALKDYEIAGEIIAYNTGVVYGEYNGLLELCKCCGQGFYTPCDRCGGSGHLPQYNHVSGGVCFKCNGVGHVGN
jgi:hypothetical protein